MTVIEIAVRDYWKASTDARNGSWIVKGAGLDNLRTLARICRNRKVQNAAKSQLQLLAVENVEVFPPCDVEPGDTA